MPKLSEKENCCGCGACMQACPKQCITLLPDSEGFSYPKVNDSICIECRACERVCPVIGDNKELKTKSLNKALVAYVKNDELRMSSSSGGIFGLLANYIIDMGGIIVGAAFDDDLMVHHIIVDNKEDLKRLQGSKYLQSRIERTYDLTKQALDKGAKVLFSGTACQIAGLKAFLKKEYSNLYTVDVLCHGVPSPKVWKSYLNWQSKLNNASVESAFFRDKKHGWKVFALLLRFSNKKEYEQIFTKDLYMQLFLKNICLRPSCHHCKFKDLNRPSDITVGDCWGIEQYMPGMDDDKGTSIVIAHTQKGLELFDSVRSKTEYREADVDVILPPSADSRKSVTPHENRRLFFKLLNRNIPFDDLEVALYNGKREKIRWILKKVILYLGR